MTRSPLRFALGPALTLSLGAPGCSGGDDRDDDGADYGEQLVVDAAMMEDRADRFAGLLSTCVRTGEGAAQRATRAGVGADGSCGGSLEVGYDHADGVTTYTLDFQDFCLSGNGSTAVLTGRVVGTEIGTPSDSGPIVEALEVETVGAVTVDLDGTVAEITATGLRSDYGKPAAWEPGVPDAANPNRIGVESVEVVFPNGEAPAISLADLEIERVGAPVPVLTIASGVAASEGEGWVGVHTAPGEPLSADITGGSGVIVLTGAQDSQGAIRIAPGTLLSLEAFANGVELPFGLDCSAGTPILAEAMLALTGALPLQ